MGSNIDYLIEHAIENVWCSPYQDLQFIYKPVRISERNGNRDRVDILLETYPLPTKDEWYHVFAIGELTPSLVGMDDKYNTWISCQHQINTRHLILDIYTKNGIQFPKAECFIFRTKESGVVIAVKEQVGLPNLIYEDIWFRCYTNAYFASGRATGPNEGTKAFFTRIDKAEDIEAHMVLVAPYKTMKGLLYSYVNGIFVENVSARTCKVGDIVESIWDSSIKYVKEFPIKSLETFISTKDNKLKYLLHDDSDATDIIDFKDDNDIFLIKRDTQFLASGRFFHHNAPDAVRMVTHRDYSVPTSYVQAYIDNIPEWNTQEDLTLRIHVRHSGFDRPLVNEHDRIKELYKLNFNDRQMALLGIHSVIPNWTAANLENGKYVAMMNLPKETRFTHNHVLDAYGYNATSTLLTNTPLYRNGKQYIELPVGLQRNSTIFEYDKDGVLLTWHRHIDGRYYVPRNGACSMIEGLVGTGTFKLSTVYNATTASLKQTTNYAFYKTKLINEVPDGLNWEMAVPDVDYQITKDADGNRTVRWLTNPREYYTAIKNDDQFLVYDLNLEYRDSVLRFTVNIDEVRTDDNVYRHKAEIPFGKFEIYLNGKKLINGLGYVVKWPEICIFNKEYLVEGPQRITLRGTGFCDATMYSEPIDDYGWVIHEQLSRNNKFDIRDDKVMRICVDGRTLHRDQLRFVEDTAGVTVPGVRNGAPYLVEDTIVPLKLECDFHDQFDYRKKSKDLDKLISGYMTSLLPEPPTEHPNPIPQVHQIYSPYCAKVMWNLVHGLIREQDITDPYSDQQLMDMLEPFDWLLKYDPCFQPIDLDYVVIHPHNLYTEVNLTHVQWMFLSRTVKLKLKDRVNLSHFVTID